MSGFMKNSWSKFLNGGESYNFKYNSETPVELEPAPMPMPPPPPAPPANAQLKPKTPNNPAPVVSMTLPAPLPLAGKKTKKVIMPAQTGGKRKSKRHTKKRRHSRHK